MVMQVESKITVCIVCPGILENTETPREALGTQTEWMTLGLQGTGDTVENQHLLSNNYVPIGS